MPALSRVGCSASTCRIRPPRGKAPNPLANHYRCRDGRWFIMALFNEQRQLRGFLTAIGCTHLGRRRALFDE
jgi:formyl-CoA transferase